MKKSIYLSSFLCLALTSASYAQTKTNTNTKTNTEEQEKSNDPIMKVIGAADTLIDPSFVKLTVIKRYEARDIDGDPSTVLQAEIGDILRREGIDSSKYSIVSMYNAPVDKKATGTAAFTVKVYDVNRAQNLPARLSAKSYSINHFAGELDDNMVSLAAIDKALLPRAIQSGKEKATVTATQLGVKTYNLQRFTEGGLKNKSTNSRDVISTTVEKIRLEKAVNLIYKID